MSRSSLVAITVTAALLAYGAYDLAHKPAPAPAVTLGEQVDPSSGVELPVTWGDLGARMAAAGVIDPAKMRSLYPGRFSSEDERLLTGTGNGRIHITRENAPYLLNLLWALGLANDNPILHAEMEDPRYGGAGNFASTGGWTVGKGNAMNYYGKLALVPLTLAEQALVEKVSRGIYRPCCGNSAHFPDCNHGMAMLGLLELMASQGARESEMWHAALTANSYWFPDTYETIAAYLGQKGVAGKDVTPQQILGANYSSAGGYAAIAAHVTKQPPGTENACGV